MKVKVLKIVPSSTTFPGDFDSARESGTFDVLVLIGNEEHRFKLAVDLDQIGDRQIQIVRTDFKFDETFKFDLKVHRDICKLVSQFYNHQPVQLPIDLGELTTKQTEPAEILTNLSC